jgi:hypothetical protein
MKRVLLAAVMAMLLVSGSACGTKEETTTNPAATPFTTPTQSVTPSPSSTISAPTVTSSPSPSVILSEQPDTAARDKYFSELGVGRVPAGADSPIDLERNVTLFKTTDQICLYGTILVECQLISTMYDTDSNKVVEQGGLPKPMMGGFAGWEPMPVPAGKYEYKVYVGDALVGVFPFEVVE